MPPRRPTPPAASGATCPAGTSCRAPRPPTSRSLTVPSGRDPVPGTGTRPAKTMRFDGASVFVTGGSRGIGKTIAVRFAELGARRVAIGYLRNDSAAEATAEELRAAGAEPVLVRGNVSSDRVARDVAELGPLDALVHNAATGVIRPALEVEKKHWDWTLDANSHALLALARAAASQMQPGSS